RWVATSAADLSSHGRRDGAFAAWRIFAFAQPHHVGRRAHPPGRLPTADSFHYRSGILQEPFPPSHPAHRWLHPDYGASGEGCDAFGVRKDSRWRNRLSFSGRTTDPFRYPPPAAARLRDHRAAGGWTAGAGLARSTLGFHFFVPRPALFHQMATANSL